MNAEQDTKIKGYLTKNRAVQFGFLTELVRRRSDKADLDQSAFVEFLSDHMRAFGFDVDLHEVPEDFCQIHGQSQVTNLVCRRYFGEGPTVALSVNMDTAPAGANWRRDPFSGAIENGRMYGRGSVRSKGSLAAYVFAVQALAEIEKTVSGTIELHITWDGEAGGELGVGWLLSQEHVMPDAVICPGTTHSVISAANGVLQLEVDIKGHGAPATRPADGNDALEAASRVMAKVYGMREVYAKVRSDVPGINSPSIVVSEIAGGESGRNIAERCRLTVTRSLIPEEDARGVENEITNMIGVEVTGVHGVLCKIRRIGLSLPLIAGDKAKVIVDRFQALAETLFDVKLPELGTPDGTMARHYAARDIPVVLYGVGPANPADAQVGAANEVLDLDDLRVSTELLSHVLAEMLDVHAGRGKPYPRENGTD